MNCHRTAAFSVITAAFLGTFLFLVGSQGFDESYYPGETEGYVSHVNATTATVEVAGTVVYLPNNNVTDYEVGEVVELYATDCQTVCTFTTDRPPSESRVRPWTVITLCGLLLCTFLTWLSHDVSKSSIDEDEI